MATSTLSRAAGNLADDAAFRVWGKWLSDALTTLGWAKTADTGQIDWTTVAKPAGTNTSAGYEIRTSPAQDGYQQLYIKVEWGTGSGATYPSLWVTLGTGSNGSGTLTGVVCTRDQFGATVSVTGAVTDRFCGGNDWVVYGFSDTGTDSATGAGFLAIERLTDVDGNYQTAGWAVVDFGGNASFYQALDAGAAYTSLTTLPITHVPPSYAGSSGVVFVALAIPQTGSACYPMRAVAFVAQANKGGSHSFAIFPGKTQTFQSLSVQMAAAQFTATVPSNQVPLIRWE